MRKFIKKTIPVAVAASLAFSVMPSAMDAKSVNGKGNGLKFENKWKNKAKVKWKLKDIDTHWAKQDIYKMYSLGLIKGYEDLTYQPNKPVTQLEALSLLVRILELEDDEEIEDVPTSILNSLNNIPTWAKTSMAIAIEEDLLEDTKHFQPNKPATRLFITNALVKLIGANLDENWEGATALFKDVDNLNKEEKASLAFATLTKLISGYSDQTFQPNKPITRAEMAVLLNRVLNVKEKLGDYVEQSGKGSIELINTEDLEITINRKIRMDGEWKSTSKKYDVEDDAKIYVNGKESTFAQLDENMKIEFIINEDGDITFISAKTVSEEDGTYTYQGLITELDGNIVWVKVDLVSVPLDITSNVRITTENSEEGELTDLKVGQKVAFNLNESGDVTEISFVKKERDEEITKLLNKLEDLEKLSIEIEGDDDFKGSFYFEKKSENDMFVASVDLKGSTNDYRVGRPALKYMVNLFEDYNIDFSKDDVEIDELKQDLINEYDIENPTFEGTIVVDGTRYDLNTATVVDDEIKNLLKILGELESLDVNIQGENSTEIDLFFEKEEDNIFEAQVKLVNENNSFNLQGKTALRYVANLIEDENINFKSDDQSEVEEFIKDLIDKYEIKDPEVDGTVVIDEETYDLDDIEI